MDTLEVVYFKEFQSRHHRHPRPQKLCGRMIHRPSQCNFRRVLLNQDPASHSVIDLPMLTVNNEERVVPALEGIHQATTENDQQKQAVELLRHLRGHVGVVQGVGGAGKMLTLVGCAAFLLDRRASTLATAPTHEAAICDTIIRLQ